MPVALGAESMFGGRWPQPWDGSFVSLLGVLPASVAYAAVTRLGPGSADGG
ncbi:hypothetical protein K7640_18940 [Micromonospora sp. PLK6-60]|uniref:hypothetical protein n=1 Tax=Micromonospora sp. PLK6-60 TaxID=2873383 RepID=UPI001CA7519F|nr:hypothetical protein [Micromonospora sp. PLK6-60]MBY8873909.1 hypothetical protein [Micromonospora sp. PLK6-60]